MKKNGYVSAFGAFFYCILLVATLGAGFYLGSSTMTNYREHLLMEDAQLIDHSLKLYAQTQKIPAYPSDMHDISVARSQKHWMLTKVLRILRHGDYDESQEIKSRFRYTPILDAEKHYTMYTLEVTLPNGQNYYSPGSTHPKG